MILEKEPTYITLPVSSREWIEATGGGLLFEPEDVQNLGACLERLLEDPAGTAEMGKRGQEVVHARFSNRHMAEEMLGVYRGLGDPAK